VGSGLLDQPFHRLALLGALGQVELLEHLVEPLDLPVCLLEVRLERLAKRLAVSGARGDCGRG